MTGIEILIAIFTIMAELAILIVLTIIGTLGFLMIGVVKRLDTEVESESREIHGGE